MGKNTVMFRPNEALTLEGRDILLSFLKFASHEHFIDLLKIERLGEDPVYSIQFDNNTIVCAVDTDINKLVPVYLLEEIIKHPDIVIKTNQLSDIEVIKAIIANAYTPVELTAKAPEDKHEYLSNVRKNLVVVNNLSPKHLTYQIEGDDEYQLTWLKEILMYQKKTENFKDPFMSVVINLMHLDLTDQLPTESLFQESIYRQALADENIKRYLNNIYHFIVSIPLFLYSCIKTEDEVNAIQSRENTTTNTPMDCLELSIDDTTDERELPSYIPLLLENMHLFIWLYQNIKLKYKELEAVYWPAYFEDYIYENRNLYSILEPLGYFDLLEDNPEAL